MAFGFGIIKETFHNWSEDKASMRAAALAYFAIFAIAPLLIVAVYVASIFFSGQQAQATVMQQLRAQVGDQGAAYIGQVMQNAQRSGAGPLAMIGSIVAIFFGAAGLFTHLQEMLDTIWGVKPAPDRGIGGMIRQRLWTFVLVLLFGVLLLALMAASAILSGLRETLSNMMPGTEALWPWVDIGVSFVILTILFAMIFKILPDAEVRWSDVWVGAIVTAILFTIGKYLLGLYLGRSSVGSTYGAAGSLVVLLLWIYYSAQIFFFGAEFTQVWARRRGAEIHPARGAIPAT